MAVLTPEVLYAQRHYSRLYPLGRSFFLQFFGRWSGVFPDTFPLPVFDVVAHGDEGRATILARSRIGQIGECRPAMLTLDTEEVEWCGRVPAKTRK